MKKYPALAFEFKDKPGTYIDAYGLDTTTDAEKAFAFVRKDGKKLIESEVIELAKESEIEYTNYMESLGEHIKFWFKPHSWLEYCNLVEVEISEETYNVNYWRTK
ncbi:hypothetical protein RSA37_11755 [Mammaliicoccus sciuri]|uniref:hypothetical protein n=1 Tax=Mammaliicoccus sciuri TaxID=1296 RepID=UPI0007348FF3|nr:hypothetical protein [Mammaliicoccus sciuri]KTT82705.1 hypothetical protein NS1R_12015 [Mammaliicoccus sciuri]KTT88238.1 hypothetical protein NS112_09475 [Mammaliicoccus sciuri]KTT89781.1 hypothetical protein NS36R_08000 [Mammaliicoccus sciuri]KTT94173.1 hypothetical protein NS44R_08415 [Mammaliicoccus sciuri]KTW10721.1 hypothetical protein RSA37_11755 [Mammaliicoccus sciuri]